MTAFDWVSEDDLERPAVEMACNGDSTTVYASGPIDCLTQWMTSDTVVEVVE